MLFLYIRLPVKKPTPIHRRVVRLRYTYKKKAAHFHKLCDTGKKNLWYTVYDRIKFVQNMTLTLGSVFKGVLSVVKQFFWGGGVIWYICRICSFLCFPSLCYIRDGRNFMWKTRKKKRGILCKNNVLALATGVIFRML